MEAVRGDLIRELCRPTVIDEIKKRFYNLDASPFNFAGLDATITGRIEVIGNGVLATVADNKGATLEYSVVKAAAKTCEEATFSWPEHALPWNEKFCFEGPYVGRLYAQICTHRPLFYTLIPYAVCWLFGIGSLIEVYQNLKANNNTEAVMWAAAAVASIALPFIYNS